MWCRLAVRSIALPTRQVCGMARAQSHRAHSLLWRQGDDLRFDLEIDFQTALFGGQKKIRITHLETCGVCSGSGVVSRAPLSPLVPLPRDGVAVLTPVAWRPYNSFRLPLFHRPLARR